jgi:hypothetical protein
MNFNSENQNDLSPLELQLASTLKPVKPSPGFIQTTRRKFNFASPTTVAQRLTDSNFLLVLLAGVLGAVLVIISGTRILFYLTGRDK